MDYRFPKWLRFVVRKLDFLAIPNIGPILAGIAVLGFFAYALNPIPVHRFMFDADAIIEGGEYWRLISFPLTAGMGQSLFFVLFHCLYLYYACSYLEAHWGTTPLSVYMIFSYLCAMVGALFYRGPVDLAVFIMENVALALGTLLPDVEFTLYFLLPVKAKWLAVLAGALIMVQFINSHSQEFRICLLFAFLPYFVFFGPLLFNRGKDKWKQRNNRRKFDRNMWH